MEGGIFMNNEQIKESNNYAIAGFILSFFIAVLGLIFSIIGLKKSKVTNTGKGLSIAGIIISCIPIAIFVLSFLLVIFSGFAQNMNKNINESISEKYCSKSYDCVLNSDGKYTCKYLTDKNKVITIDCDAKN